MHPQLSWQKLVTISRKWGSIVYLRTALIAERCECGTDFCYICGDEWHGMHGCPHYGPAVYDEEDYNQDGFHRTTGLNREGRTRRDQALIRQEEEEEPDDEDDEVEDDDEFGDGADEDHPVLQHVDIDVRAIFAALPREERELFLMNLQIELFEERGITFDTAAGGVGDNNNNDDGEANDNDSSL